MPNRLLDEVSLQAIKKYVDDGDAASGKVDDVKINNNTVVTNKIANIAVDGTYNASSNKVATQSTVTNAINALDVSSITGFGVGKTLETLTETDGKIAATFQDIQLASTAKVTGLDTALAGKVPTSRTIAGIDLVDNITSSELITALGLQQAMTYIGAATTTKPSAGQYVQTVIGSTTYYVSLTTSGTATQVNATKGQILTVGTKEYICTTAGASGTNVFSEMGDESSYALKTITITGTGALGGGGNLTTNRTITHKTQSEIGTDSSIPKSNYGFVKLSSVDTYGHIIGVSAVTKADLTGLGVADDSAVVHNTGVETVYGTKTFKEDSGTTSFVRLEAIDDGNQGSVVLGNLGGDITVINSNQISRTPSGGSAYYINLPSQGGVLALTSDIPSVSDFVKGPSSSDDGHFALFNGTTGKLIKQTDAYISGTTFNVGMGKTSGFLMAGSSYGIGFDVPSSSTIEFKAVGSSVQQSGFIRNLGSSTNLWTNLFLSGNLTDGTNSTTIANITSHIGNSNIHVTSADKTNWNGKVDDVTFAEITVSGEGNSYSQLQQQRNDGSYEAIASALSYNEAYAILTGTAA